LLTGNLAGNTERMHHGFFININPLTGDILHARPLRLLKAGARCQSDIFKLREIGVEAVQDNTGEALLFVH
jgi:hypothetical protein